MSFILDALKKSESERQRQGGPALFEVKVAPPRGRFAIWAVGLGALLAINLVVVGWMALRGSSSRSAAAVQAATGVPGPGAAPSVGPSALPASPAARSPGADSGAYAAAAPRTDTRFGAPGAPGAPTSPGSGQDAQTTAVESAAPGSPARTESDSGDSSGNSDDLAPAVEPERRAPSSGGQVVRATESGLPTYQEAAQVPGANIPDLHLDLSVYEPQPDQRFVMLNLMKLHEGDSLPTGVRVEQITRDGVILSFHGTKFVLQTNP
jgi:general secretion pathway protein B